MNILIPVWTYAKQQAKQPSTWRGLIMLAGSFGVISMEAVPQLQECTTVIAAVFAGSGLIGVFAGDK